MKTTPSKRAATLGALALAVAGLLPAAEASGHGRDPLQDSADSSLAGTRLSMEKWIETQQILARERNEWQQGKEILQGRLELVKNEVAGLEAKIAEAQAKLAAGAARRTELAATNERLKGSAATLTGRVTAFEGEVKHLFASVPDPLQQKLQPLLARIPEDPTSTRVSVAERFQNVLGILNELNRANNEITVNYEVRTLVDGKPSEVRVLYVGLAQAYYVSAGGEAGIGRPTPAGWTWEPSRAVAGDVLVALDILQGKHTPAFVPLPVKIQ